MKQEYKIIPVAKPRMTKRDKWLQRPIVKKYWEFKAELRAMGATLENGNSITFIIPMPESWSIKKKAEMNNKPHQQTPDIDNFLKAVLDCLFESDSHIYKLSGLEKYWGYDGKIIIS